MMVNPVPSFGRCLALESVGPCPHSASNANVVEVHRACLMFLARMTDFLARGMWQLPPAIQLARREALDFTWGLKRVVWKKER